MARRGAAPPRRAPARAWPRGRMLAHRELPPGIVVAAHRRRREDQHRHPSAAWTRRASPSPGSRRAWGVAAERDAVRPRAGRGTQAETRRRERPARRRTRPDAPRMPSSTVPRSPSSSARNAAIGSPPRITPVGARAQARQQLVERDRRSAARRGREGARSSAAVASAAATPCACASVTSTASRPSASSVADQPAPVVRGALRYSAATVQRPSSASRLAEAWSRIASATSTSRAVAPSWAAARARLRVRQRAGGRTRRFHDQPALVLAQRTTVVGLDEPDQRAAIDHRHDQRRGVPRPAPRPWAGSRRAASSRGRRARSARRSRRATPRPRDRARSVAPVATSTSVLALGPPQRPRARSRSPATASPAAAATSFSSSTSASATTNCSSAPSRATRTGRCGAIAHVTPSADHPHDARRSRPRRAASRPSSSNMRQRRSRRPPARSRSISMITPRSKPCGRNRSRAPARGRSRPPPAIVAAATRSGTSPTPRRPISTSTRRCAPSDEHAEQEARDPAAARRRRRAPHDHDPDREPQRRAARGGGRSAAPGRVEHPRRQPLHAGHRPAPCPSTRRAARAPSTPANRAIQR